MEKLTIIFVALFVSCVVATPANLFKNLKSLEHVKRSAKLLKPLHLIDEQKKNAEVELAIQFLDTDGDGMLNMEEMKSLLAMGGATPQDIEQALPVMKYFDTNGDGKFNAAELEVIAELGGM